MRKILSILILLIVVSIPVFAANYSVMLADGRKLDCTGILNPPTARVFNITMSEFKNHTSYYVDQLGLGNTVNIINYKGANFQVIKL